jgi:nicotinamidase-related amidase
MLIDRDCSCLLVVDLQEKLVPAMAEPAPVLRNAAILMQAAARLRVPVVASEQYPQGLGPTVPELRALAPDDAFIDKTSFSCADVPGIVERLQVFNKPGGNQVVICGVEAHVCVLQSALGLKRAGFVPFVVADATTSRTPANRNAALKRLGENGVEVVTTEMVIFEWLGRAGTPEFKEISRLIK